MEKTGGGKAVFARWTSEYDNDAYTDWWYIVHDSPYELEKQKKSHKRKIKKGLSNFECKIINPLEYAERMAEITILAWDKYPAKYRPTFTKEQLKESYCKVDKNNLVFGCFNGDGLLCGFDFVEASTKSKPHNKPSPLKQPKTKLFLSTLQYDSLSCSFVNVGRYLAGYLSQARIVISAIRSAYSNGLIILHSKLDNPFFIFLLCDFFCFSSSYGLSCTIYHQSV